MRARRSLTTPTATVLAVALLTLGACVVEVGATNPVQERAERVLEESVRVQPGTTLRIRNLAGVARLVPTGGDSITVRATVTAGGDDDSEAERLADRIQLRSGREDGDPALIVAYPVDDYSSFHYDNGGDGGIASWFGGSHTRIEYEGQRISVSTTRRSGAASVHADLEIGVPEGASLRLLNAVGRIDAADVNGDLALFAHSGTIHASGGNGSLVADTGSGGVDISDRTGNVLADTGSGSVVVRRVRGEVRVDTGSGGVDVEDVEGPFVGVDTGSGSVDLLRVSGALDVDTGSGSVAGDELRVIERVRVDTGSGSIRLEGDFSALTRAELDTGSGRVTLRMTGWPGMRLDLRTSSGGIDVDLPDTRNVRSSRGSYRGEVGDEPRAEVVISTSSGGIRIQGD